MSCLDERQLEAYALGALGEAEASAARGHLVTCERCRIVLDALKQRRDELATATVDPGLPPRPSPPVAAALPRGTLVGRYLIVGRIGVGGMGEVYAAVDPELGRRVAIKLVVDRSEPSVSQSSGQVRLLREAQAMARLSHPAVVGIYDVGTFGGGVFLAMELIEGTTLTEWLKTPRPQAQVLALFIEAARGLAAAHHAGLVHRDFKPDNVLVGADGRVRVTDFGLARGLGHTADDAPVPATPHVLLDDDVTVAGAAVGTLNYMAPEQILRRPVDPRTDQFSFCVSLYRALYHAPPFAGRVAELARNVTEGKISPAPEGSTVPGWLRATLLVGLSVDPAKRFASMEELIAALEKDPALVRRRWAVRSGAVASVALVALGAAWLSRQQAQPCQGAEQKLAEVWNPAARASIEKAFDATGKPYAKDTARSVIAELDRVGGQWVAAHVDACQATWVRKDQTEDMLALRMGCLDDRLRELGALAAVFAAADEDTVKKSVQAVTSLEGAAACSNLAALSAPLHPPADPARRVKVETLRARLAGPRASLLASKFKVGLPVANALDTEAEALAYLPLLAETRELRGELLREAGELKDSETVLLDAITVADQAHHDEARARAAVALLLCVGVRQGRYEAGEQWGRVAEGALLRAGEPDELSGTYWSAMGSIADAQGHFPEAVKRYERSLSARTRASGPDGFLVGYTLNNLGQTYFNLGDLEKARAALTRALALERKGLGDEHPTLSYPLMNLGSVAVKEGKLDEGLAFHQQAYELARKTLGDSHPTVAGALGNLAETLLAMKRYDEAIARAQEALAVYDRRFPEGHPSTVYVLAAEAEAQLELGQPAPAQTALDRAQATIAKNPLPKALQAKVSYLLARALLALKGDAARIRQLLAFAHEQLAQETGEAELRAKVDALAASHSGTRSTP